jgi:hypothetical protein
MGGCEGLIVINTGAAAMITAGATALFGMIGWAVREALHGRDNHIKSADNTNADLTETNRILMGTTAGAVDVVKRQRATTGRAGR